MCIYIFIYIHTYFHICILHTCTRGYKLKCLSLFLQLLVFKILISERGEREHGQEEGQRERERDSSAQSPTWGLTQDPEIMP